MDSGEDGANKDGKVLPAVGLSCPPLTMHTHCASDPLPPHRSIAAGTRWKEQRRRCVAAGNMGVASTRWVAAPIKSVHSTRPFGKEQSEGALPRDTCSTKIMRVR